MLVQLYSFVKFFIWYSAYRGLFPSWKRFCNWISMGIYSTAHASRPRATDKRSRAGKSEITGSYVASLSLFLLLLLFLSFFHSLIAHIYSLSLLSLSLALKCTGETMLAALTVLPFRNRTLATSIYGENKSSCLAYRIR